MPADNDQPENVAAAVTEVSDRVAALVREEIELARAEVTAKITSIARGLIAVAAGSVFGVFAIVFVFLTTAWGLNSLYDSLWLGFATVLAGLCVATLITFLFAWRKLRVGPPAPTMAIDEAKKIRATVEAVTGEDQANVAEGVSQTVDRAR